jgi:hypothetical protein
LPVPAGTLEKSMSFNPQHSEMHQYSCCHDQESADSLSPEKMQLFIAGLSGLAPEEVRKAKVLYIRNAVAEFDAIQMSLKGPQGCIALIPFFWPMLMIQKRAITIQIQLKKTLIHNAIDVWRDDLKGERFQLDGEDIVL